MCGGAECFRASREQWLVQGLEGKLTATSPGGGEGIPGRRKREGKGTEARVRQGALELDCGGKA